jgi:hypothetical protein
VSRLLPESSLSEEQAAIHTQLPQQGSFALFPTDQVSMEHLLAVGRVTGDEYSLFTNADQSLVIRGVGNQVKVSEQMLDDLLSGNYGEYVGHTHPPGFEIDPSINDRNFLGALGQEYSTIYGDAGSRIFTSTGPIDDARVASEINRQLMREYYGQQ